MQAAQKALWMSNWEQRDKTFSPHQNEFYRTTWTNSLRKRMTTSVLTQFLLEQDELGTRFCGSGPSCLIENPCRRWSKTSFFSSRVAVEPGDILIPWVLAKWTIPTLWLGPHAIDGRQMQVFDLFELGSQWLKIDRQSKIWYSFKKGLGEEHERFLLNRKAKKDSN